MTRLRTRFLTTGLVILLAACASPRGPAPVVDRGAAPASRPAAIPPGAPAPAAAAPSRVIDTRPETYVVKRGETLYSIALDQGLDYRELAQWNNLSDPNRIQVGQALRLRAPVGAAQVTPITAPGSVESRALGTQPQGTQPQAAVGDALKTEPKAGKRPYSEENFAAMQRGGETRAQPAPQSAAKPAPQAPPQPAPAQDDDDKVDWGWPTSGKVIAGFSEATNKGIDISGKSGDPVLASAGGRVVYSGQGLRGYGKLIIVKHNNTYLSAYAHNKELLVKEGQTVVKGQKIAEVGNTDADQVKLHFEIRRLGKPVDPAKFLPDRPS
ncbi:MAG: peptidoglycan DD-metalloendopeptidase family protein [Betaproteobacteria bacterium]